jgi:hypothetical protein
MSTRRRLADSEGHLPSVAVGRLLLGWIEGKLFYCWISSGRGMGLFPQTDDYLIENRGPVLSPISARCDRCWATPTFRRRRSTRTSRAAI